jgi:Trypsin
MKKLLLGVCTVITVLLLVVIPLLAITYGWLDENRHPNVGAWGFRIDGQLVKFCSGTLISPTVFLTAGHCTFYVQSLGITQAEVTFDSTFSETSIFHIGTIHTDPDFKNLHGPDPADVGVIVFEEPIVGITPAALAPVGVLDQMFRDHTLKNQEFTTVGYGLTAQFRGGPPEFGDNSDRRYAISPFVALTEGWLHVSENPATDDGGTCYGDSGGPTFIGAGAEETPYIVATTSKGDYMCRASDVRYRIDTPTAHEFLGQYVTLP